jgi:DNA transformation protein and related proteins
LITDNVPRMAATDDFLDFVVEQLAPLGSISARRFFGGKGIYLDGTIIAFIIADALYFKVDAETRSAFEAEGSTPFTYASKTGERVIVGYYQAPDRAFDDPEAMQQFATLARRAALRAAKSKPKTTATAKKRATRR